MRKAGYLKQLQRGGRVATSDGSESTEEAEITVEEGKIKMNREIKEEKKFFVIYNNSNSPFLYDKKTLVKGMCR